MHWAVLFIHFVHNDIILLFQRECFIKVEIFITQFLLDDFTGSPVKLVCWIFKRCTVGSNQAVLIK